MGSALQVALNDNEYERQREYRNVKKTALCVFEAVSMECRLFDTNSTPYK